MYFTIFVNENGINRHNLLFMATNEQLLEIGKSTRFSSENQPEVKGRRKMIYTVIKEKGYSKSDIVTVLEEMFWYTEKEAKEMISDPDAPLITKITGKALLNALKKGNLDSLTKAFEYVLGKPDSKIKIGTDKDVIIQQYMQKIQDIDYVEVGNKAPTLPSSQDELKNLMLEVQRKMDKK